MLPPPVKDTAREPVKYNVSDLDGLISELNTPKEQIINSAPRVAGLPQPPADTLINNGAPADPFNPNQEPITEMPDEVARTSAKVITTTIDTAFGTGCSLYAKNANPEKYQATDKQRSDLESAWVPVCKKLNFKVEDSPYFFLIILLFSVYWPHFQEAKTDRRFAMVDERISEMQRKADEAERRLKALEEKEVKPAA